MEKYIVCRINIEHDRSTKSLVNVDRAGDNNDWLVCKLVDSKCELYSEDHKYRILHLNVQLS